MASPQRIASFATKTACRSCDSVRLEDVLELGWHPLPDFTQRTPAAARAVPQAPLCLAQCKGCGLVQLRHTVNRGLCFGPTYPYRSGVNATMRGHLRGIVEQVAGYVVAEDAVLDIGSNDGTLLSCWPESVTTIGFEPALGDDYGRALIYAPFEARLYPSGIYPCAKVITSIAMFYDLDDPRTFVRDVALVLHPEGVWANEFNYLPLMLEHGAFDHLGHEHLCYYDLRAILRLYQQAGLEVFHAETNGSNGGSLRVMAGHPGRHKVDGTVQAIAGDEGGYDLQGFASRALAWRHDAREFLARKKAGGGRVWVYGASTRGLTLLHAAGIDETLVEAAADRNPDKWGCYIPGTAIPIVSEEAFRVAQPDYALVLPYSYMAEFTQRERGYLNAGGRFILPVPTTHVVGG